MLDYALNFYNNYTTIFYILLVVSVIIEGPITILTLSFLAPKFWFSFILIYFFSFIWEFTWDLIHYFIWRYFKKNIFKDKNFKLLEKIENKLKYHSLFDKLIVIKYTPPITSIGLIYLWFQKVKLKRFIQNVVVFSLFNWILITFIWYYFWILFVNNNDLKYIIIWFMLSFLIIYFLSKIIASYFVKKILNEK
jgi:membrane protein DedA with SNARE-associated domain